MTHCPGCICDRDDLTPAEAVLPIIDQLCIRYGSLRAAGRAYSERYGLRVNTAGSSGERLFQRLRDGYTKQVGLVTLDRIKTLAAS